jgi:hypothetical protein
VIGHETFVWYIWKKGKYAPAYRAISPGEGRRAIAL